MKKLSNFMY